MFHFTIRRLRRDKLHLSHHDVLDNNVVLAAETDEPLEPKLRMYHIIKSCYEYKNVYSMCSFMRKTEFSMHPVGASCPCIWKHDVTRVRGLEKETDSVATIKSMLIITPTFCGIAAITCIRSCLIGVDLT